MVQRQCRICGKRFKIKEFHAQKGWGKFCSVKCRSAGQKNGVLVKCAQCGKEIYRTPRDFRKSAGKRFFCNVACHCAWENKHVRCGVNAANWIAGESAYRALLRRAGIKETCRRCGISDQRVLTVHHRDGNRKNNDIKNLEWLCANCHRIAHSKRRR